MKKIVITLEAEYGSNFQKEVFETALGSTLLGLITFINQRHRKNKIKWVDMKEILK